jgi:hypothetical protein
MLLLVFKDGTSHVNEEQKPSMYCRSPAEHGRDESGIRSPVSSSPRRNRVNYENKLFVIMTDHRAVCGQML